MLSMLNPAIELKSMLLCNAVESFKEEVQRISIQFPNASILIGHLPGVDNPSDSLTKLYKDPVDVINSILYREGPEQFRSIERLSEDTVATYHNGEFKFLGLPAKFLSEPLDVTKDKCNQCGENVNLCALARTRSQANREEKEDAEANQLENPEVDDSDDTESTESTGRKSLQNWLDKVKVILRTGPGDNLVDHHYAATSQLILNKTTYYHMLAHYFHFEQIFRVFCFMASVDIAKNHSSASGVNIRKEGMRVLLRTAQKNYPKGVKELSDADINQVKCMSLRLQSDTARRIFNTKWLPVISWNDPLKFKVMRHSHELGLGTNRRMHNLEKTSHSNLLHGETGMTWHKQKGDVKRFVGSCGICLRYKGIM